ncbi:DUF4326 domain-containing protein [Nonomuraea sp. NPDC050786]|uniref:DUF4326 domain-containing protein n=1 Tax=Nonomuraea sp. NPDC050786 TaxID=3154840 RepID=UPI0033C09F61
MGRRVKVTGDLFHGQVPAGAVYIGRAAPGLPASPYANLHSTSPKGCRVCYGRVHTLAEAIGLYRAELNSNPELVKRAVAEIGDRDVACWCPDGPCHGDVLLAAMAARR